MKRRSKTDHIVLSTHHQGRVQCLHCGFHYTMTLPAPFSQVIAASKAFEKDHVRCPRPAEGLRCGICLDLGHEPTACPVVTRVKSVSEWFAGPDTGLSSRCMAAALTDHPVDPTRPFGDLPADPDDFGRCYRFLAKFPALRADLPKVAARHPRWAPLVREWDRLTALYEEEVPNHRGAAPKLYALMTALRREAGDLR